MIHALRCKLRKYVGNSGMRFITNHEPPCNHLLYSDLVGWDDMASDLQAQSIIKAKENRDHRDHRDHSTAAVSTPINRIVNERVCSSTGFNLDGRIALMYKMRN